MNRLTIEDLKKLPEHTYIPCYYSFRDAPVDKGYLYRDIDTTYLKHNDGNYNGLGQMFVKDCKYSWKLYGNLGEHLSCLTVLEIKRNLGEL